MTGRCCWQAADVLLRPTGDIEMMPWAVEFPSGHGRQSFDASAGLRWLWQDWKWLLAR